MASKIFLFAIFCTSFLQWTGGRQDGIGEFCDLRQDGLDTLGTSTQTLIEHALLDNRYEEAKKLIPYYFHIECQIVQKLMFDWMKDLQLFISDKSNENGLNERAQEQQEQARNERYCLAMSKADEVLSLIDNK